MLLISRSNKVGPKPNRELKTAMTQKIYNLTLIFGALFLVSCGGGVIKDVPQKPDISAKYIFYLHGSVEESKGSTKKYQKAVNAISSSGATVISEVRGKTKPTKYTEKLKSQVEMLIGNGVPAKNITITGFAKGAIITLAASVVIDNPRINYVLLGGCSEGLNEKFHVDSSKAVGRLLSIYDSGDDKFGSCEGIVKPSGKLTFKEIVLDSGKGRKVFRIPKRKFIKLWRNPLVEWAGVQV